ncbi:unnamed protein product [Mycena citricolor]|uniref:Saccharopine dehydrogenase NADP binding domain-containing protein n=1 Tax=Mycena citricolor TaxID=2018698 RepID=A0AAD2K310_9AGAR|nr:unnamed protein product [Mycena citricolor]
MRGTHIPAGFTGRLIAHYLASHKDRDSFVLSLAARSKTRLDAVVSELGSQRAVRLHVVDVTRPEQIDAAVAGKSVVINTVGPFWTWSTPVVKSCVRNGVHYVDLTGETHWIKQIITSFHYSASKTGAIIVPSCGFDSVPADILSYLSARGISGGTIATMVSMLEEVHPNDLASVRIPYPLSPFVGDTPAPAPRLLYRLPIPESGKTLVGSYFFMTQPNRAIVERSWGLFKSSPGSSSMQYGNNFKYDEMIVSSKGVTGAILITLGTILGLGCMMITPLRWLLLKVLPKAGDGPSQSVRDNGWVKVTNITTAVSPSSTSSQPSVVKSVLTGKGDPGYSFTSVLIGEAALTIALSPESLPSLARSGGVFTPATALGDVYIERLRNSGRATLESKLVTARAPETRKTA